MSGFISLTKLENLHSMPKDELPKCPICGNDTRSEGLVCYSCDFTALDTNGNGNTIKWIWDEDMLDHFESGKYDIWAEPSGPNIVFIGGEQFCRRFHFGGWITMRVMDKPYYYRKERELGKPYRISKIESGYRVYSDQFAPFGKMLKVWINVF